MHEVKTKNRAPGKNKTPPDCLSDTHTQLLSEKHFLGNTFLAGLDTPVSIKDVCVLKRKKRNRTKE